MKRRRAIYWLLGICLAMCSLMVARALPKPCRAVWWCPSSDQASQIIVLLLALPMLFSFGRGMFAGLRQLVRTWRMLRDARTLLRSSLSASLDALGARLNIQGRIDVVDDVKLEVFCYGLIRPRICVTSGLLRVLDDDELEAVLRHEHHHLRRRDPLRTLLWTVVDATCWRTAEDQARTYLQRELAADRAVILAGQRRPLARALLKLLTYPLSEQQITGRLAVSGISVTNARIDQLVEIPMATQAAPIPFLERWQVAPALLFAVPLMCAFMLLGP